MQREREIGRSVEEGVRARWAGLSHSRLKLMRWGVRWGGVGRGGVSA